MATRLTAATRKTFIEAVLREHFGPQFEAMGEKLTAHGKALAAKYAKDIGKAVLGSESDAGADRIWKITASVKPEARGAVDQIAALLNPLGVEYDASAPGHGGSDLSEMHAVGMAGLSLHQDATRYFDWHHTANDTLDKIDPEQLRQNVAVYVVAAYLAAQANGDFGSAPGAFAKDSGE